MNEHLYKQFDAELDDIRASLTRMGGMVEEQLRAAMLAFSDGDREPLDNIVARDAGVDRMEMSIDAACMNVIARRQPTAIDLRMIMGVGKVVTDLERIGDEAKKIAKATRKILDRGPFLHMNQVLDVQHTGEQVIGMLHQVLDAFVRLDVDTAAHVIRRDTDIDQHFEAIARQLITYMMEDPRTISSALDIVFIAKSLERIGDHCTNIAEDVVYIAKGRDVRHISIEGLEREVQGG